jgi:hypothetical protein
MLFSLWIIKTKSQTEIFLQLYNNGHKWTYCIPMATIRYHSQHRNQTYFLVNSARIKKNILYTKNIVLFFLIKKSGYLSHLMRILGLDDAENHRFNTDARRCISNCNDHKQLKVHLTYKISVIAFDSLNQSSKYVTGISFCTRFYRCFPGSQRVRVVLL